MHRKHIKSVWIDFDYDMFWFDSQSIENFPPPKGGKHSITYVENIFTKKSFKVWMRKLLLIRHSFFIERRDELCIWQFRKWPTDLMIYKNLYSLQWWSTVHETMCVQFNSLKAATKEHSSKELFSNSICHFLSLRQHS